MKRQVGKDFIMKMKLQAEAKYLFLAQREHKIREQLNLLHQEHSLSRHYRNQLGSIKFLYPFAPQ